VRDVTFTTKLSNTKPIGETRPNIVAAVYLALPSLLVQKALLMDEFERIGN
jgi:hypothetical protein